MAALSAFFGKCPENLDEALKIIEPVQQIYLLKS